MPKEITHSVIVLAYNQEKYIAEALDSILLGPHPPDQIIVVDDCSSDSTVVIIDRYRSRYPTILEVVRNTSNLGIFDNLNMIYELPVKGEVISFLAGDDIYDQNLFFDINAEIIKLKLDPLHDKFMMLPNVANLFLDGTIQKLDNTIIEKRPEFSPFQIALRSKLYSMHVGISIALYRRWARFPVDAMSKIGIYADLPHYLSNILECNFLIPIHSATTYHRVCVGVTSWRQMLSPQESKYRAMRIILSEFNGILTISDSVYIKFNMAIDSAYVSKNIASGVKLLTLLPLGLLVEKIDKVYYLKSIYYLVKDFIKKIKKFFR